MKSLLLLFVYAIASGLIGLIACSILLNRKKTRAALVCALIFFGGPLAAYVWTEMQATLALKEFESARKEVQELCAKNGGDKIYKTVDNVEGVFQIKARNPDPETQWRDQYGMVDPWGRDQADLHFMTDLLTPQGSSSNLGYIYYEQQPPFGQPEGPPYRRFYLKPTGKKVGDTYPGARNRDNPELAIVEEQASILASKYGYLIEDLSTPEMRKKWIGGGRIKIIDLRTKEVLAERTGYFRAAGPAYPMSWSGAGTSSTDHRCPTHGDLLELLPRVLKPVSYQPIPHYSDFQPR